MKKNIVEQLHSGDTKAIFEEAKAVTDTQCGDSVHIRGVIEYSNFCARDCMYCGLRKSNRSLKRYRMAEQDIIDAACKIAGGGIKTVVFQSGDDLYYTRESICNIIKDIKKKYPDVAVTLSIGERPLDDYNAFRDAGADRYLLKHETINAELYERTHPGQSLKYRLTILEHLKRLGFHVGIGNIIGLPFQTLEDLAEDILFIKGFSPYMIGMGPFIPQGDTPFGRYPSPSLELVLKCLAIARKTSEKAYMPATTALATLGGDKACVMALSSSCNVMMANFTPKMYRGDYKIYEGKAIVGIDRIRGLAKASGKRLL